MPELLVCGAEGEWALFENTLSATGADDKRRGSVDLTLGDTMFKAFTGTADTWVHVRLSGRNTSSGSTGTLQRIIEIRNASNQLIAGVKCATVPSGGVFSVNFVWADSDGGSEVAGSERFSSATTDFVEYDIRIQRSTVTDANDTLTLSFYRNSQLRLTQVVTDAGGWSLPGQLQLSYAASDADYDQVLVQDVVVSDAVPTVGMELAVLVPGAVGNYSAFTNNYTNIDDEGYDASTGISTASTGNFESWIFQTPTFDLGDKVIYAVVLDTVAQLDLAGVVGDFEPLLRIAATDYSAAAIGANNVAPDSYLSIWTQNPATTAPWVEADLTALEAGVESVV